MEKNYKDCDPDLAKRIEATLYDNCAKISKEKIIAKMKKDFLEQEEEREVNIKQYRLPGQTISKNQI